MKKLEQQYIELLKQDKKDSKEIINDLIRINERLCLQLQDIVKKWQDIELQKAKGEDNE